MSVDPDKPEAEAARETVERAAREGRSLAVDVLEEYMRVFRGMSAFYQPGSKAKGARPDPVMFEKWARLALRCAESLAEFQTAKLKAIAVAAPAPQGEQRVTRIELRVFETGRDGRKREVEPGGMRYLDESVIEHEPVDVTPSVDVRPAEPDPVPGRAVVPGEPVAAPAAPNVFRLPPPSPHSPEPPRPTVQEYADSIASAVGPDGRPRAVNAKAISQAALSRAAMPNTRSAGMPRRSGVFDR